jgi:hypothetical protein
LEEKACAKHSSGEADAAEAPSEVSIPNQKKPDGKSGTAKTIETTFFKFESSFWQY